MPLGKTTLQPGVSIGQPHTPIPSGTQQTGDVISLQPGVITGSTPNLQPSDATQHHIIPSDSSNEPQTTPDLDLGVTLDLINTTGLGGGAVPVKPSPEPDFDWTTTIIVICVILGIIFIGMLCLICYCLCKGDQAAKASKTANMTDLFKPAQKRGKRVETSIPVRIVDYEKYYMDLAAKSYFKFSEQFEDLKYVGRDQSCNAGIMPNNQQKNRFTNVLPYDFSRVMLMPRSDIEGSDYINASFIPGCNSKREYIATQGPLPQTRNDFWRMVWEQNAACIIMLTQCIEEGKDKSDYYWPQSKDEPRMYGSIQVQLARESPPRENKEWAVREFILYKGGLSRRTTMFHFTAWPDFSVPNNPQSLIRFIHRFRQDMTGQDGRPKVVMCSAGVGRTGVLLGLDILLQKLLKNEQIVDIYGLVHFMRQHRPMMVQTEQQYIFLHQCVLHILKQRDPNNATWDSFLDAKISTDDERPLSDSWS